MKRNQCLSMTLILGLMCMFTINLQAQELKVVNQNQSAIKVEQKKAKANAMTHKVVERKDKVDLKAKPATGKATLNVNQKLLRTSATQRVVTPTNRTLKKTSNTTVQKTKLTRGAAINKKPVSKTHIKNHKPITIQNQ